MVVELRLRDDDGRRVEKQRRRRILGAEANELEDGYRFENVRHRRMRYIGEHQETLGIRLNGPSTQRTIPIFTFKSDASEAIQLSQVV